MEAARYWHRRDDGTAQCDLCPHACVLGKGKTGLCMVRTCDGRELIADGYGAISSAHIDPIEKKPLHHFHPGAAIYSIGGWGCNFACKFCQNWTISQQVMAGSRRYRPEDVAQMAPSGGSIGVAYTYNEPLVGFEFVEDCAKRVRGAGLVNVLVTNGYINAGPAAELLPLIDALNIDVKSMDDAFYLRQCRGKLPPVLAFCKQAAQAGCHVEITNLVIPGLNDTDDAFQRLSDWVAGTLGPATPLHLSAYHPQYKSKAPSTPPGTLMRACEICRTRLSYVYLGNLLTDRGQNTECPQCGAILVARRGYDVEVKGLRQDACLRCGRKADIVLGPRRRGE